MDKAATTMGSLTFSYEALPMRVVFGAGSVNSLPAEVTALGLSRVLVLSTPEQKDLARSAAGTLGDLAVGIHAEARMHVPVGVVQQALATAADLGADGCVAVGGGSTIGLGKAIALHDNLPVIAVPTTYAGSEMTTVWGLTEDSRKHTGKDRRVLPRSVIYDPELTLSLPPGLSATSGMNAIAHAVEALYAPDASPVTSLLAEEGVRALAGALPDVATNPTDLAARSAALYGAWLCGACLGATTMSLHHKLCHILGGTFHLPHAETHTVMLPHVLAYNAPAAPPAVAALRRALGTEDPAAHLQSLAERLGAPTSLRELGLDQDDLGTVVQLATQDPYANPRAVTSEELRLVVAAAYRGTRLDPEENS